MDDKSNDDHEICHLLGGLGGYLAQFVLFVFVLASLLAKRMLESPQRPMKVWAMDVSKQGFSSLAAHICNMITAILAADLIHKARTSACSWYFVVFTADTTVGVSITILLHNLVVRTARWFERNRYAKLQADTNPDTMWGHVVDQRWFNYLARCGYYGDPPSFKPWMWQSLEWTIVNIIARILCGLLVIGIGPYGLVHAAGLLDRIFAGHPQLLLAFVMVMCPIGMNIIQALIQDMVLKWSNKTKGVKVSRFVDSEQEVIEIVNDGWSDED